MRFNSGSSIKNNAYSSSSASSNTNEKLKKLNEELDQLEMVVSNLNVGLSGLGAKVGTDSVADQIELAKTEIENAISQSVTTQEIKAESGEIGRLKSDTITVERLISELGGNITIDNIKSSAIFMSPDNELGPNYQIDIAGNGILFIAPSTLILNVDGSRAIIINSNDDLEYYYNNSVFVIHPKTNTICFSNVGTNSISINNYFPAIPWKDMKSGVTVEGPLYADLAEANLQNINVSGEITADTITAENANITNVVSDTAQIDDLEAESAEINELDATEITSDRINSSQIHTKIDKENIGYTTIQEHQDTEEYTIGIPITNGLWEIELEGYIKATIDKTNSAVLITYWRESESALTRVGVKDGIFYFYTRKSGKLYFSNNTLEVNDTTVSVNAPNDPGYPVPETLDKEINITANEGVIATETMVVDNLIVTGEFFVRDSTADKVAIRTTDDDQDFNVTFTTPLPSPENEEGISKNYIYGDSELTYNPNTNTLGTGNIKVEKDIELVDSVDAETEEVTYSSGEAYQYLSVSCEADGETLRAHWEDAATTISCANPKLTSSQTIASYNGKTAENKYPITHLGTCTTLHGNMGDGYLCLDDARLYSPALYAGANTVCKLMVDGICNPKIYDRTASKCHDVASWVCEAPATSTWNSIVCNNGVFKKLTTTDHVKAACVTACDTVLACCNLVTCGDLTVAGETNISGGLCANTVTANCFCGKATCADIADNSTCFNGCTYAEACADIRSGLATQACADAIQDCADFIQSCVTAIEEKIPSQASSSNQLADKEFVNSSITTNTANFRGTYACVAELPTTGNTNNDYAFVCSLNTTTGNYIYDRYKWVASDSCWVCEYELNTTGFTAEQLASINSGITDTLVAKITDVYDNTVTVCMNGECKGSFNLNQNTDVCIDLGCTIQNATKFDNKTYNEAYNDIRSGTVRTVKIGTSCTITPDGTGTVCLPPYPTAIDNATCFNGCTYAEAKADILSGCAADSAKLGNKDADCYIDTSDTTQTKEGSLLIGSSPVVILNCDEQSCFKYGINTGYDIVGYCDCDWSCETWYIYCDGRFCLGGSGDSCIKTDKLYLNNESNESCWYFCPNDCTLFYQNDCAEFRLSDDENFICVCERGSKYNRTGTLFTCPWATCIESICTCDCNNCVCSYQTIEARADEKAICICGRTCCGNICSVSCIDVDSTNNDPGICLFSYTCNANNYCRGFVTRIGDSSFEVWSECRGARDYRLCIENNYSCICLSDDLEIANQDSFICMASGGNTYICDGCGDICISANNNIFTSSGNDGYICINHQSIVPTQILNCSPDNLGGCFCYANVCLAQGYSCNVGACSTTMFYRTYSGGTICNTTNTKLQFRYCICYDQTEDTPYAHIDYRLKSPNGTWDSWGCLSTLIGPVNLVCLNGIHSNVNCNVVLSGGSGTNNLYYADSTNNLTYNPSTGLLTNCGCIISDGYRLKTSSTTAGNYAYLCGDDSGVVICSLCSGTNRTILEVGRNGNTALGYCSCAYNGLSTAVGYLSCSSLSGVVVGQRACSLGGLSIGNCSCSSYFSIAIGCRACAAGAVHSLALGNSTYSFAACLGSTVSIIRMACSYKLGSIYILSADKQCDIFNMLYCFISKNLGSFDSFTSCCIPVGIIQDMIYRAAENGSITSYDVNDRWLDYVACSSTCCYFTIRGKYNIYKGCTATNVSGCGVNAMTIIL